MIEAVTGKPFKNIVLLGFKGSGKSSVGRELAQMLGFAFLDLDDMMEEIYRQSSGKSLAVREVYSRFGKEYFMQLEKAALNRAASLHSQVISFGGGTPLNPAFRKAEFVDTPFVQLKVPREELFRRIEALGIPPFIDKENPEKSLYGLMDQRFPKYDEVSDLDVENHGREPGRTAEEINRKLEEMYAG